METLLFQILSALVGALTVYIFGIRKLAIEHRNAFLEKQLSQFYSPIAGYRKRIRTKSELRVKISNAAEASWQEICASASKANQTEIEKEQFAQYKGIIEYDNQQLREEFMPLYRKMLDVFTANYWLADEDTRAYYQNFVEFVEIWERHLEAKLPGAVIRKLDHTEENVFPFYEHLDQKLSELQTELKDKPFWSMRL